MAIAFFIPDQASLLRKASQQEQQILRMRENHWRFLARVMCDAIYQYVIDSSASAAVTLMNNNSSSTQRNQPNAHQPAAASRKNSKLRKPSQ